jgi:hypothetical protein
MTMLIKVIIIYSAFGVQLGSPVYMMEDYPTPELCQAYQQKFMNLFPQQLNLEYSAFADSKCMSQQEFIEFMEQTSPPSSQGPAIPSIPVPEGPPSID